MFVSGLAHLGGIPLFPCQLLLVLQALILLTTYSANLPCLPLSLVHVHSSIAHQETDGLVLIWNVCLVGLAPAVKNEWMDELKDEQTDGHHSEAPRQ